MTLKTLTASCLALLGLAAPASAAEHVVRFAPGTPDAVERALVADAGGRVTRDLDIIDGVGADLPARALPGLEAHPRVTDVAANARVELSATLDAELLATAFNQSQRTDKLWNSGGTGKGIAVAVVDTGIDGSLPDFQVSQTDTRSRVIASAVTNPDATTAGDSYGHGTHVAGLVAGNGFNRPVSDPLFGKYAGAAPDANLVSVKVSDETGASSVLDVIAGLQFVVDHKDRYGIRVVNLSLNSQHAESYRTDPLDAAVEAAWLNGIVVVTAAGNRGTAADAVSYAPANDPYVITVGAVDDRGTKSLKDDALASWSSRGRTQDGLMKPDVIAPGARLVSTLARGSAFSTMCSSCLVGKEYLRIGGTSMSAGVVSGAVAAMLDVNPHWTPDEAKTAIVSTTRAVGNLGRELDAEGAAKAYTSSAKLTYPNAGLVPNTLIDPVTGDIDYTRASWSRASWSDAAEMLRASWSRASWSCDCSRTADGSVDPARASWSRASWSFSPSL